MQRAILFGLFAAVVPAALAVDDTFLLQSDIEAEADVMEEVEAHGRGEELQLKVHPVYGPDLPFSLQSGLRLHVLMRSVCKMLNANISSATFTRKGLRLDPWTTTDEAGLVSGDVIEVSTPKLLREQYRAMRQEMLLKRGHQSMAEVDMAAEIRTGKARMVEGKVSKLEAEARRKEVPELRGDIGLRFVGPMGQDVYMGVMRNNWLDAYLELVTNRMGVDRSQAQFFFRDDNGHLSDIEPHDTPNALGLADQESILVRVHDKP